MLQNLLQTKQKKKLEIEYYVRLVTVAVLMFSGAVVIGISALVPAYMDVKGELEISKNEYESHINDIESTKKLADEVSHSTLMLSLLKEKISQKKLTTLVGEVLKDRPDGIMISGFSYNRSNKSLSIQGVATTRDLVIPYAQAIETSEYFEKAPVPISDLAKNNNLDFRLTIELAE